MEGEVNVVALYAGRRQRLAEQIDEGIALISSPGVAPDPLLFDRNLHYLTGLESRKAILVLAPRGIVVDRWETQHGPEVGRGRRVNELLFVEERTEAEKTLDGEGPSYADVQAKSGVAKVYPLSQLNDILGRALMQEEVLWLNTPSNPGLGKPVPTEVAFVHDIHDRYYWLRLKNIAPKIHALRWVKDEYEIECLRQAFANHAEIYKKIMRALKPGENESLGQAIFDYEVRIRPKEVSAGLDLYGSSIIVAAGKNATIGHYMDNNQEIKDGDLVLIDAGVVYNGYSSDITTTFPANGRFTPRQRELYAIVLEAQKRAIEKMRPGAREFDAHKAVYDCFDKHGLAQYGYGTCGHPVGLNIHDANGVIDSRLLEPGVVLVIEPWLSIPEEGIGIRIESGVLITDNGPELLPDAPKEIEEIEDICQR
ncbi:MAG: aminopeptidase P N-terminal domain-containing protein [Chloroflexi bacterium]|nr:aminopeptidase P N-terminal domain-containing protein [Chloroflexota bacterium]MCI0577655.1 aminopeptidase P N-terminal domain-containing protein [Chloroflexota bacterium]MCI0644872.1 aminopeptidase P N-terminal domain-containing protein [Chloroflexota bacterium]MCI0725828.1 aminopeptidase P N-terminal domain-containing protein [Chloroflexota bacterium]